MRVCVKLVVIFAALTVTAIACASAGDDGAKPTGTVLGVVVSPIDTLPDGSQCGPVAYRVQAGDTLSQVAVEFDASVDAIVDASELSNPDVLVIGQELIVPCPGAQAVPTESTQTPGT